MYMLMPGNVARELQDRGQATSELVTQLTAKLEWLERKREELSADVDKCADYCEQLRRMPDTADKAHKLALVRASVQQRHDLMAVADAKIKRVRAAIDACVSGSGLSGLGQPADVSSLVSAARQIAPQLVTKKGRQALLKSVIAPEPPPEEETGGGSWWPVLGLGALVVGGLVVNSLAGKAAGVAAHRDIELSRKRNGRRARRRYALA